MIQSCVVNNATEIFYGMFDFMVNPVFQLVLDDLEKHWAFNNLTVIFHLKIEKGMFIKYYVSPYCLFFFFAFFKLTINADEDWPSSHESRYLRIFASSICQIVR